MSIEADIKAFEQRLDAAIRSAMETEVADATKRVVANAVYTEVYDAYEPEFYSRRMGVGGLADPEEMEAAYDEQTHTLEVSDKAPWQQLYGGAVPSGYLAEAVETGDARYNMQLAGARKFHSVAEANMGKTGAFAAQLRAGLKRNGF